MTISRKLWLGFGTLTALLVLVCGAILLEVRRAGFDLERLESEGRPRYEAVKGIEPGLLKFALGLRTYLETGERRFLDEANSAAAGINRRAADYQQLATTNEYAALSGEFQRRWNSYREFSNQLVETGQSLQDDESLQLAALRIELEDFINRRMQPTARAVNAAAIDQLARIEGLILLLLGIGAGIAVGICMIVGRGVASAEQKLRCGEESLRLAIEGSEGGEWEITSEASTLDELPDKMYISHRLKSFIGFTESEFPNSREAWLKRVHPDDLPMLGKAAAAHLEGRTPYHRVEYRVEHKDGTWKWISSTGRAYRNWKGNVIRWAGVDWDITEQRQSEEALRASEERFRAVQQATPDGFMIFKSLRDPAGGIIDFEWLFVNPAAEAIVGRVDLVGKRLLEQMPGNGESGLFDAYVGVTETGEVWQNEFHYQREGMLHWFRTTAAKVGDGFAVSFADTTRRHKAEATLEQSRMLFSTALEAADMGTWVYTLDDQVCQYDERARRLYGLSAARVVHDEQGASDMFHPDDLGRMWQAVEKAVDPDGDKRYRVEYRVRDEAGGWRWLRVWGLADFEERGGGLAAVRIVGASRDITESKQAVEALEESDRRKDEFLAILAHELRNPLAAIRMALNLAGTIGNDPARLNQLLTIMDRQSGQLVRLIDDLLDISRITRGNIELRKQRIDLISILANVVDGVRSMVESSGVAITLELPPEPLFIEADPVRVTQVFGNLLNNACKYTGSGGEVLVAVVKDGGQACARVRDTGVGLAADQLNNLFKMFTQIDPRRDRAKGGLGIGPANEKGCPEKIPWRAGAMAYSDSSLPSLVPPPSPTAPPRS